MARDARLIIKLALDRVENRYMDDAALLAVVKDVRGEIDYAFDLAQVPKTPGRKPKPETD